MRCANCGAPARHAPIDGSAPAICDACQREGGEPHELAAAQAVEPVETTSGQQSLADHGASGQTTLFGYENP